MVKRFVMVGVAMAMMVFMTTPSVFAGEDSHDGFFLGGGFVYNDITGSDFELDPGAGWDIKIGYNFGWVALEADVFQTSHKGQISGNDYTLKATLFNLKAYYIPSTYRVRGYVNFGFGFYDLDSSSITYMAEGFQVGPGLEIFFNQHLALNFNILYRDIKYDEYETGATKTPLNPTLDGNALSSQLGLNVYF